MKKIRIAALTLLFAFVFNFSILPSLAIIEKTKVKKPTDIFDVINITKWQKKNDPYLEKYILLAIENNKDIKTTALKIEEANLNKSMVRANQLPTLSVGASPVLTKMPYFEKTSASFSLPIYASYELDLFGKNWDKTKSAKKVMESTIYEAESADIGIISAVISTYYNIVNLDKILEIQENLVQDRNEIHRLTKLSNKEGLVSSTEVILAEKAALLAENDLITYKKMRQNALNALAVLIGDSANNVKEYKRIKLDEISFDFIVPEEINSEIIVNRPDYKAAEKLIEAAGLNIRAAKKEFLPTIDILGLVSFVATSASSSMSWKNAIALAGASATLPVFTGFKRTVNVKLNKNKYEQLLQKYEKTNLQAIQEVNDSLYNFKSDNEKLSNNIKAYEIQKKDFKLAEGKYEQGVISKLNLLQQRENLLVIKKLISQSKTDCLIDEISLYKATGAKL